MSTKDPDQEQQQEQPAKKPRAPRKPREAKPVEPAPEAAAPGSDATEGLDLLASAPDPDEEVEEAQRILDEQQPPNLRTTATEINKPVTEESSENEKFIEDLLTIQEDAIYPSELNHLLQAINVIAEKHKAAALKAGQRAIAGDFNALLSVSRQLAKRAASIPYWKGVPS